MILKQQIRNVEWRSIFWTFEINQIILAQSYVGGSRAVWAALDMTAPPVRGGMARRNKFKLLNAGDHDPNDSRYTGPIQGDYIKDPNDSRYDPNDPRHLDVDYAGPPEPSNLGW